MAMTELDRMARDLVRNALHGYRYEDEPLIAAIMTALTKAPPGWKLVPEQITDAMDEAAYLDEQNPNAGPASIWKAFLAAAPEYKEAE